MTVESLKLPSIGEEIANSITHGLAALASLLGLVVLINQVWHMGLAKIIIYATFGISMVAVYTASTMYHALSRTRAKNIFLLLDHSAIYLLIAGTYTPFTLGVLKGVWGWTLFSLEWILAISGICIKSIYGIRWPKLSMAVYIIMGWLMVIAIWPLINRMPSIGLGLVAAGGACYTIGTIFNGLKKLRFAHMVWHIFVIAGSIFFFAAIKYGYAEMVVAS